MAISKLAFLGIRSDDLDSWSRFATELLGMEEVDRATEHRAFRLDERRQRLMIADEPGDTIAFIGWEVERKSDLETYASRLDDRGIKIEKGTRNLADKRLVEDIVWFSDPAGNRIELVYSPMVTSEPFRPGRPHSGFVTGPLGMGHAVIHVKDAEQVKQFYTEVLDFTVSDFALVPFPMYFLHVNERHHSFAIVGSGRPGFHHFMIEHGELDDVGQGYDLALREDDAIGMTMGRHTNDWMTSFYWRSPSGFFVETGWGGRVIDTKTWQTSEMHDGPNLWGHHAPAAPEEVRRRMQELRLGAAQKGLRAPPISECPWLFRQLVSQ